MGTPYDKTSAEGQYVRHLRDYNVEGKSVEVFGCECEGTLCALSVAPPQLERNICINGVL